MNYHYTDLKYQDSYRALLYVENVNICRFDRLIECEKYRRYSNISESENYILYAVRIDQWFTLGDNYEIFRINHTNTQSLMPFRETFITNEYMARNQCILQNMCKLILFKDIMIGDIIRHIVYNMILIHPHSYFSAMFNQK